VQEVYVDEPKEEKIETDPAATELLELYEEYYKSEYRKKVMDRIKGDRESYDGHREPKNEPWEGCANYSMMIPTIVVDNCEPRVVSAIIGRGEDFVEVTSNSKVDVEGAPRTEAFLEWALLHNIKWPQIIPPMIHNMLVDGTIFILPRYEEYSIKRGVRQTGQMIIDPSSGEEIRDQGTFKQLLQQGSDPQPQWQDSVKYQSIKIWKVVNEFIMPERIYGPDEIIDWEETPIIWTSFYTYEDLEEKSEKNGGPFINITKDLKVEATSIVDEDDKPLDSDRKFDEPEIIRAPIKCINGFIKFDLGEGRDWCYLTVAYDSETIIRKQYMRKAYPYNCKPMKRIQLFQDGNRLFGVGLPHKVRHHAKAINDCVNQMIDTGTIQVNPPLFYSDAAGLPDEIEFGPGGINRITGDPRAIDNLKLGVTAQILIEFVNLLTAFMGRLVPGGDSYASGTEDTAMAKGMGTASGMQMLLNEGQIKHNYLSKSLKEMLSEVIEEDLRLYAYFMPTDIEINDGEKWLPVDTKDLLGDYNLSIRVSDSSHNDMMERMEALELFQLAVSVPFANSVELFKELLAKYDKKNPEKYIKPEFLVVLQAVAADPQIVQVIQQYMQQKQMQQQAGQQIAQKDTKDKMLEPRMMEDALRDVTKSMVRAKITDDMERDAALKHMNKITQKDILDAEEKARKKIATEIVEGFTVGEHPAR
jgi:hypothetical protein